MTDGLEYVPQQPMTAAPDLDTLPAELRTLGQQWADLDDREDDLELTLAEIVNGRGAAEAADRDADIAALDAGEPLPTPRHAHETERAAREEAARTELLLVRQRKAAVARELIDGVRTHREAVLELVERAVETAADAYAKALDEIDARADELSHALSMATASLSFVGDVDRRETYCDAAPMPVAGVSTDAARASVLSVRAELAQALAGGAVGKRLLCAPNGQLMEIDAATAEGLLRLAGWSAADDEVAA